MKRIILASLACITGQPLLAKSYISECAAVLNPNQYMYLHSLAARYALAQTLQKSTSVNNDGKASAMLPINGVPVSLGLQDAFKYASNYASAMNINWSLDEDDAYAASEVEPYQTQAFVDCVRNQRGNLAGGVELQIFKKSPEGVEVHIVIEPEGAGGPIRRLELRSNGLFDGGVAKVYNAGGGTDRFFVKWTNPGKTLKITAVMRDGHGNPVGEPDAIWMPPVIHESLDHLVSPDVSVQGGWDRDARIERDSPLAPVSIPNGSHAVLVGDSVLPEITVQHGDLGKQPGSDDWGMKVVTNTPYLVTAQTWCAWRADEICTIAGRVHVDRVTFTAEADNGQAMDVMHDAPDLKPLKPPVWASKTALALHKGEMASQ